LIDGNVPISTPTGPLAAGSYSFEATYNGDQNYLPLTSSCEPFDVAPVSSATDTVVYDADSAAPWTEAETTGASAFDTATVAGVTGFPPTGSVTYSFFPNMGCTPGTAISTQMVTLTGGSGLSSGEVPDSSPTPPLAAGTYSFQAVYSGDSNYQGSTSLCEQFGVAAGPVASFTTQVVNDTTGPVTDPQLAGSSFHDTATVTGVGGFTPTGTVTYNFFTVGDCSGTAKTNQTVEVVNGAVEPSVSTGPLPSGNYSYQATYSGDANYSGSTSDCEPFSVIPAETSTATQVIDDATGDPPTAIEATGSALHDTATVNGGALTPTGTVSYRFFTNLVCSGIPESTQTVDLSNGTVPNSTSTGPLKAGFYAFEATYNGDPNHLASTSECEPFIVVRASSTSDTRVFDAATKAPWTGTETTGASAFDRATVQGTAGIPPTGTVAYTFFTNGSCAGAGSASGTVTLNGAGLAPNSDSAGPLAAGNYSFQATYRGDTNYKGSTSACEPFDVTQGPSTTATRVFDAATKAPWTSTETTGASAFDKAAITGAAGIPPTGTVTYRLFTTGDCSGTAHTNETVDLTGGAVPSSASTKPLSRGSYSFEAIYSGDDNYNTSTAACEPFGVLDPSSTATQVIDDSTGQPATASETAGSSFHDTTAVAGTAAFKPTGTVTYSFFAAADCGGQAVWTQTVNLNGGAVPNSKSTGALEAGSYSFLATYSGDANFHTSTAACEPLTVAATSPAVPPAPAAPITNVIVPVTG
jgi:hypothetical protein